MAIALQTKPEIETQLRLARAYAANELPYFAEALFAAKWVLTEQLPHLAAIDQHFRLYFNPKLLDECFASLSHVDFLKQLGWVFIHEIAHVLRDHPARAERLKQSWQSALVTKSADPQEQSFDPLIFNCAADLEINDNCFGTLVPPDKYRPLTCETFEFEPDHLAEYYYEKLLKKTARKRALRIVIDEGSGIHGEGRPWEVEIHDPQFTPVSEDYQNALRMSVAQAVRGAKPGSFTEGWMRWAESLQPKMNWRQAIRLKLNKMISQNMMRRTNTSYLRPNRRATAYVPFIRPGHLEEATFHLAVVVDTSGSMDQELLNRCMSEVRGILISLQCSLSVIPCDMRAYDAVKVICQADIAKACQSLQGGGGTDLRCGIEAAMKLQRKPDGIIVLTDGFTPYPDRPIPGTPIFFGIISETTSSYVSMPSMPPWKASDILRIPLR